MAFEKVKSGRTPEQQAARDARKAAKKAAAAVEAASTSETKPNVEVESVTITTTDGPETITTGVNVEANAGADGEGESSKAVSKKRKHNQDVEELEVDLEAPTPMNKKEARLAKKKAKRVEDGEEEPSKATDKPAATKQVHPEKRNSVWVGNLSFRTTPERLQEFFEAGVKELGGMDGSVTRVNLPKEIGKGGFSNNKGFAYVDFKSEEDQKLAIELSERLLEGRKLLIKLGNDYTPKPDARTPKPVKPKGLDKQVHPESSTVFVGNLPFDATEEGLRDMIEANAAAAAAAGGSKPKSREPGSSTEDAKPEPSAEAGVDGEGETEVVAGPSRGGKNSGLRKVRLGAFEDTGRCKGFAFLDFKSPAEATAALTHRGNKFFLGRRLILQYASEEATNRSGGGAKRPRPAGAAGAAGAGRPDGDRPPRRAPRPTATDGESASASAGTSYEDRPRPPRPSAPEASGPKDTRGKKWEAAGRKAPGAALAAAKREKVGIVEATGTKVVFD